MDELFEATKVFNNLKNHDFTVADYKMSKDEAETVKKALSKRINGLEFDARLKVIYGDMSV